VVALAPDWVSQVKIRRIDIARDFQISDPGPMRKTLETVVSRYQRERAVHSSKGNGWTISNKSKSSGVDRFYDKTAEALAKNAAGAAKHSVPAGTYRFEAALREQRIDAAALTTLDQVTSQKVWDGLSSRWAQTRWGTPITSGGGLQVVLDTLSPNMALRILGYLHAEEKGLILSIDSRKRKQLGALCRELGLTPGLQSHEQGGASTRVDLWQGCLVPASP